MRRCARPGLFRTPSRPEDLLRAAAIKQRAQKTPVGWLGVRTPKQFRRTCTSVSPFFAITGRRLGALTARDKFMHSPKSCRKNPKPAGLQLHVYSHSPQTFKRIAAVLINLTTNSEVDDAILPGHLNIRRFGFQKGMCRNQRCQYLPITT